ncbi:MAG: macrolide ABC transporter ATP-binding protein [Candidatus Niyogibacteria bacterium CG10_big_fil_rev_8_21_14_0_10_42_19]|uniref:Macrolide ABC transporter ATP-binding protein n=1 Tax=Candidatus Niyogibacteria bacterium CG10_big_fil_rev_8_21_14_0_10_42_19 TaxID=1974725 RepID=A0A2H0TG28_9BACT|nr:MAG: macrolide ABC transporter ATP-binding protein [Candidatus Niyogibacteria bacterium CG10_big_fil_rev_8_21_14_0_10_42_19]
MSLIEVKDLAKIYYGDGVQTPALSGVSFDINKGDFVAIMGPSGSGKSTLLHILGFLDRHTHGKYLFEGKTIDDYSDDDLAHIRNKKMGFVFQMFNLLPRTTILDNVKLPLLYSDIKESGWDKIAKDAIKAVGLEKRIDHEPSQLSGGEKQRVAIARALVLKPEIIFADEPTGNLDSKSGKAIMEILQDLNEKDGHTVVLITHETYTAEHAGRIIRLHDGKIESDKIVDHRHHAKKDEFFK